MASGKERASLGEQAWDWLVLLTVDHMAWSYLKSQDILGVGVKGKVYLGAPSSHFVGVNASVDRN